MGQSTIRRGIVHRLGSQKNSISDLPVSEESHRIREWLLEILRFAVTLEHRDRATVMGLAAEMDRLGPGTTQSGFSYFTRTSVEFCDGIVGNGSAENAAGLRLYIGKINDRRLRRALEAVLFEKSNEPVRFRKLDRAYLWKGLAIK
jgi:hypothetical protein